jgi:hypothetical protein
VPAIAIVVAAVTLAALAPASAADQSAAYGGRLVRVGPAVPYSAPPPASRLSAAVWASDACWSDCSAQCGSGLQACIQFYAMEDCHAQMNRCDRACLRQCRLRGGPLLPFTD